MKQRHTKLKSVALVALTTMGLALGAQAATAVEYTEPVYKGTDGSPTNGIDRWETKSVSAYTAVASNAVTWGTTGATSWYVVTNANVQIDGGVTCQGHVNLILCEGAKLVVTNVANGKAAIATDANGSFTIYGQPNGAGELSATAAKGSTKYLNGAGIGGNNGAVGSNITINGGTVTTTGGYGGAGIGGGRTAAGSNITINGGTVTAKGTAAIGGGARAPGSNIAINGGTAGLLWNDTSTSAIGNGQTGIFAGSSGNRIAPEAKVFFAATSSYSVPSDFDGNVLAPGPNRVDVILVSGISDATALSTLSVTNPTTGATGELLLNGPEIIFNKMYFSLTNDAGSIRYVMRQPELTITQQPNVTCGYKIAASTDGNNGITNYAWMTAKTIDTETLMKTVRKSGYGGFTPDGVVTSKNGGVTLSWDSTNLTSIGEFRFTSTAPLYKNRGSGHPGNGRIKSLGNNRWAVVPVLNNTTKRFDLTVSGYTADFELTDLTWVGGETTIAEGETMTTIPHTLAEKGMNYICFVTHGLEGLDYSEPSEIFTYQGIQVGEDAFALLNTDGVCTIYGTGDMWSYATAGASPLWDCRETITNLVVESGITGIGSRFFENMWWLKDVQLGADCTTVEARAFKKCYGLTNVVSTASGAAAIGDYVFSGCHSLQAMTFADTPTFGTDSYSLQAAIYMEGDIPRIYPIPQVKVGEQANALRIKGKKELIDADWTDVTDFTDDERKVYHFFKVVMP